MAESKISKKQQACVHRYVKAHYDRMELNLPKGYKDRILEAVKATGEKSANSYIKRAIDEKLERDIPKE